MTKTKLLSLTAAMLLPFAASAALITEYADYGTASDNSADIDLDTGSVGTATGGWAGAWQADTSSSDARYDGNSGSLSYTATGYTNDTTGGQFQRSDGDPLHVRAFSTALTNVEIWTSVLLYGNRSDGRSQPRMQLIGDTETIEFGFIERLPGNGTTPGTVFGNDIRGSLVVGSVSLDSGTTDFATVTHLALVKVTINGAGNDTVEYWIDPDVSTVSTLGEGGLAAPTFSINTVDIGSSITGAAMHLGTSTSALDSIRISDAGGDVGLNEVLTGVPEPSTFALFAGMLALGWIAIRRRRR